METCRQKKARWRREKKNILRTFTPDKALLEDIRDLPLGRQVAILRTAQAMLTKRALNEKAHCVLH